MHDRDKINLGLLVALLLDGLHHSTGPLKLVCKLLLNEGLLLKKDGALKIVNLLISLGVLHDKDIETKPRNRA